MSIFSFLITLFLPCYSYLVLSLFQVSPGTDAGDKAAGKSWAPPRRSLRRANVPGSRSQVIWWLFGGQVDEDTGFEVKSARSSLDRSCCLGVTWLPRFSSVLKISNI